MLIASEVLEHLVDPWRVLSRLRVALKPGALVFASSPNIAHHSTFHMLLRGDRKLEDSGRMDRTHLRWFTPKTYEEMFQKCGYEVVSIESVAAPRLKPRLFNFVTGNRFDYLFMSQIFITARAPLIVSSAENRVADKADRLEIFLEFVLKKAINRHDILLSATLAGRASYMPVKYGGICRFQRRGKGISAGRSAQLGRCVLRQPRSRTSASFHGSRSDAHFAGNLKCGQVPAADNPPGRAVQLCRTL